MFYHPAVVWLLSLYLFPPVVPDYISAQACPPGLPRARAGEMQARGEPFTGGHDLLTYYWRDARQPIRRSRSVSGNRWKTVRLLAPQSTLPKPIYPPIKAKASPTC